ncbi:FAD:protein FMN transferase [Polaribacter porphyrae]|uniref:FAD:protein FMN transferase n=1 Tax=Polaribacter porphyrae TaxID=1137780 RepID=A0A2S7WPU2_9FLAO|nr:FAD:protein FMN transferase [Polaribacter porphyrae]PQJ79635.1 thiamine biosynthesis protein ApbE [Polaribacter porphyrae]
MEIIKKSLFYFLIVILFSCHQKIEKKDFILKGGVFGTSYKISYLNADKNYQESIDSLFLLINNSLSTYISTSDISKINSGDSTVVIDDFFKEVFLKSKKIYKETDGFFDPTVGNLVNAYGFGPKKEKKNLTDEDIENYMKFVGLDKVTLHENKIVKTNPNIFLDFNSTAKGFGLDVIARFFNSKNINNYLIEIGGEIRAKGTKKNNKPWLIKIVDPVNISSGFKVIDLSDKSMATSGNYRKFRVTKKGQKYVHTINPKTGRATESNLLSASVIGSVDCADVDAYATAFMAMGLEKTKAFLKDKQHLKVILIYTNKNGNLEEYATYK